MAAVATKGSSPLTPTGSGLPATDMTWKALVGQVISVFSCRYFYTGVLEAVSDDGKFIQINSANVIYETGGFQDTEYTDAQPLLPDCSKIAARWRIAIDSIESYGILDKKIKAKK